MNKNIKNICKICSNEKVSEKYCSYHNQALQHLNEGYDIWLKAYSQKLSWEEYMKNVQSLKDTGKWIKEVIEEELKNKR